MNGTTRWLCAVAAVALLLVSVSEVGAAPPRKRKKGATRMARGTVEIVTSAADGPGASHSSNPKGGKPAAAFSRNKKRSILAGAGITGSPAKPIKLDPTKPATGSAYLAYRKPDYVSSRWRRRHASYASFPSSNLFVPVMALPLSPNPPAVTVRFRPRKVGRYLVDFVVARAHTYRMRILPGDATQTFTGTQHLTLIYDATTTDWVSFSVTGEMDHPVQKWIFYSCEITPVE